MDPKITAIVKALAYTENGGKPTTPKAGKTGEMKSIFQFTPDTWKIYSKQVSGKDNLPLTTENEAAVVYSKVAEWVKEGYKTEQIASMWNAGDQRPDAYKQGVKGVNKKYNVKYDVPAYAKKVFNYAKQFEAESTKNPSTKEGQVAMSQPNQKPGMMPTAPAMPTNPQAPPIQEGMLPPQMKQAKQI